MAGYRPTTRLIAATLAALFFASASAAAAPSVRPFEAEYSGRFSGAKIEINVARLVAGQGDTVVLRRHSEPRGFARLIRRDGVLECGQFRMPGNTFVAQRYVYIDGKPGKGKSTDVNFAATQGTATSVYKGTEVELPVADGAVDKIVEEHVLAQRLAAGDDAFTLRVIDRNEVHNVRYTVKPGEVIKAKTGRYETLLVERRRGNSSRTTRIWAAPDLDYQPVRIQRLKDGKVQGTANLTEFRWLDQARGSVTPTCP